MPIDANSSLIDVCFAVCTQMNHAGSVVVLTGGSAATYYAPQHYQSRDADFVLATQSGFARENISSLGFVESGGIYRHPNSAFTLEFLAPPIAIGNDIMTGWATIRRGDELLHILGERIASATASRHFIIGTTVARWWPQSLLPRADKSI